jgi:hypothetical protein
VRNPSKEQSKFPATLPGKVCKTGHYSRVDFPGTFKPGHPAGNFKARLNRRRFTTRLRHRNPHQRPEYSGEARKNALLVAAASGLL